MFFLYLIPQVFEVWSHTSCCIKSLYFYIINIPLIMNKWTMYNDKMQWRIRRIWQVSLPLERMGGRGTPDINNTHRRMVVEQFYSSCATVLTKLADVHLWFMHIQLTLLCTVHCHRIVRPFKFARLKGFERLENCLTKGTYER